MGIATSAKWIFGAWASAAVLTTAVRSAYNQTSTHQESADKVIRLVNATGHPGWRVVHLLSLDDATSQQTAATLLQRRPLQDCSEEVFLVDMAVPLQPESGEMLSELEEHGFRVRHVTEQEVSQKTGLNGTPLLVVVSPQQEIIYAGREPAGSHAGADVMQKLRAS